MKDIDVKKVCEILNEVMECELAGVVRYTHSSMMVSGPHRIPIVDFLKEQANESLLHAQQAGEILTGLDGHPTQNIAKIKETNRHTIKDILEDMSTKSYGWIDDKNVVKEFIYLELTDQLAYL